MHRHADICGNVADVSNQQNSANRYRQHLFIKAATLLF